MGKFQKYRMPCFLRVTALTFWHAQRKVNIVEDGPALSLLILRRRIREEMFRPGHGGGPQYPTATSLARAAQISRSHVSKLVNPRPGSKHGVSWHVLDKLAKIFNCHIWQLFFIPGVPYGETAVHPISPPISQLPQHHPNEEVRLRLAGALNEIDPFLQETASGRQAPASRRAVASLSKGHRNVRRSHAPKAGR
jgi:hypothetical protein